MALKLTKTLLSKKPERTSFLVGLIGLATLALFFGAPGNLFSASGKEIFEKHGVIIEMPFDHPRINIKSKNEAAEKISNKIFNDRIKKIVA